jgi:hypothetical protein
MNIPITFTYRGKEYCGEPGQVQGTGTSAVYHLMINKYYQGCLRISLHNNRWVFDGKFSDMAEAFGAFLGLTNWLRTELSEDQQGFVFGIIE